MPDGHHAAIDASADATVPNIRMDGIREINGRGIARQNDDFALGRKSVDLFRVKIDFQRREEFVRI